MAMVASQAADRVAKGGVHRTGGALSLKSKRQQKGAVLECALLLKLVCCDRAPRRCVVFQ
jgi:hypothetical protein